MRGAYVHVTRGQDDVTHTVRLITEEVDVGLVFVWYLALDADEVANRINAFIRTSDEKSFELSSPGSILSGSFLALLMVAVPFFGVVFGITYLIRRISAKTRTVPN